MVIVPVCRIIIENSSLRQFINMSLKSKLRCRKECARENPVMASFMDFFDNEG